MEVMIMIGLWFCSKSTFINFPITILLNLCGQFMSETIYSKRFGFSIWLLQSQLPFQRWRSTFISSCETDSLYIAFASFSSLSCCSYERFFAIDWLFVHLCMHKINLLPCVSMALAKEGSLTIILIKSCVWWAFFMKDSLLQLIYNSHYVNGALQFLPLSVI